MPTSRSVNHPFGRNHDLVCTAGAGIKKKLANTHEEGDQTLHQKQPAPATRAVHAAKMQEREREK